MRNLFTFSIMADPQTDDSFQHELEDYIRQQRARGLQPKVCFRKEPEVSVPREGGHNHFTSPVLEQELSFGGHFSNFPTAHERLSMEEGQVPPLPESHHSRQRLESPNNYQNDRHYFPQSPWIRSHNLSWEHGRRVCPAGGEDRCQRRRREEEEDAATEEPVPVKRKYPAERGSPKEHQGLSTKKTKRESERSQKTPDRMDHQYAADDSKGKSQSHRKKKGHGRKSPEERDLWDEAILGSCF
ncbi:lysine-rich coiled-coil protein 1 isoform X3 [Perognathus longimembris pacificus]|uniref:lysine-rich coiled-coil protein 1 isoform X3 n=1 Tax=Perognathus longimembris pacificus TaxID=214514 RepID=UPI002018D412|nr:lysine-rich coiled-coil protein 1 isoform X3 [Perognathus longimembris pacificus]